MKKNKILFLVMAYVCLPIPAKAAIDIMDPAKALKIKAMMPKVSDSEVQSILDSNETLWYDAQSIVPGYQDSLGDPKGFRPNTITSDFINLAVPGGWENLFAKRGRFNFPFGTGGADLSDNLDKVNFWSLPKQNGTALPVVYWRMNHSHWSWLFPVGTVIGEVLMVQLPTGSKVFEIRTRKREVNGWANAIYRPFVTPYDLMSAIQWARPDWMSKPNLLKVMDHLMNDSTLKAHTLTSNHFTGAFTTANGALDEIPDFGDATLASDLLSNSTFYAVNQTPWKSSGGLTTYAPSTSSNNSIVAKHYEGGMLKVDDDSCKRCHENASREIGDFFPKLVAYGELWGEDEIFSWHPFDTKSFVDSSGLPANFNNDNRKLRADFVSAGLVKPYNAAQHPANLYKALPHSWSYHPFRK